MDKITIAIDAMGGDHSLGVTVPAACSIVKDYKKLHLILVGDAEAIKKHLEECEERSNQISIQAASQQVTMDESPSKALRSKKDSSMRVAINLVQNGIAQACVSAGNTGALMATARFVLKTLPGIDRPAIVGSVPTFIDNKQVRILDLGANVDSHAEHLYQFAVMGSVIASNLSSIDAPKVGLLNVGVEEIKGNEQVKQAARLLSECKNINYIGYIEGDDIFKGIVDVVVCDGFTGNIMLKAMEGMAKLLLYYTKRVFTQSWYGRLAAIIASPILWKLKKQLDPRAYNGASFIGLRGIVVKSHGSADQRAFANAIREAMLQVERNVLGHIGEKISTILESPK